MRAVRAACSALRGLVAAGLLASAAVAWWQSEELMLWLIHRVGEERAPGPGAVIRRPGGALLTDPGAMARRALPFWGLSLLLAAGGVLLLCPCGRRAGGAGRGVGAKTPGASLHQAGHVTDGRARYHGYSRVGRLVNLLFGNNGEV
jgi:hypothetical protein